MHNKLQGIQNSTDSGGLTMKSFPREAKQLKSYVHYLLKGEGEKFVLLTVLPPSSCTNYCLTMLQK